MPDFTATRTYLYVAGNVISPLQNTTNETGIYNPHNLAFDASTGHTHSGTTGDGPKIPAYNLNDGIVELGTGDTPYTTVQTSRIILCPTSLSSFLVIVPNPYAATWSRILTVADASGNAGTNNIEIRVNGYGIDILTGATQSVYITEDWGSITIARLSSGYWKIV